MTTFRTFENGTIQLVKENQTVVQKSRPLSNTLHFALETTLQSTNREIRLVSIAAIFGLLGASVSGLNSILTRRLWDTSPYAKARRLLYVYYARPWIGVSVGIVTYVTLRAGLLNASTIDSGSLTEVSAISDFGVAAISAIVGLMTDEIILRLRDIFRTLFGITSLQKEQELQLSLPKKSVAKGEAVAISATLTDLKPSDTIVARFFVQKPDVASIEPSEQPFNSAGIASAILTGKAKGKTFVSVMVPGDSNLYGSEEIEVIDVTAGQQPAGQQ